MLVYRQLGELPSMGFASSLLNVGPKIYQAIEQRVAAYKGPRQPGVVYDLGEGFSVFFGPDGKFYTGTPEQLAEMHAQIFGAGAAPPGTAAAAGGPAGAPISAALMGGGGGGATSSKLLLYGLAAVVVIGGAIFLARR